MCVRANRGAVRLEQQLTGQTLVVPQAGNVLVLNGQLESLRTSAGHCACEPQTRKSTPYPDVEVSRPATTQELHERTLEPKTATQTTPAEKSRSNGEPIYQVIMPPLVYDAHAKVQPEYDSKMIVLIRRVRVRPTLIFQGRVEGEMIAAVLPPPAPAPAAASRPVARPNDSFVDRVRTFVRKLWSRGS
jgi:hypothetical protein